MWMAVAGPAGLLVGAFVVALRTDRRNSRDADIVADTAGAFSRDVMFGREEAWVIPTRQGWAPFRLTGQPELAPAPAPVEVEEGAA